MVENLSCAGIAGEFQEVRKIAAAPEHGIAALPVDDGQHDLSSFRWIIGIDQLVHDAGADQRHIAEADQRGADAA